MAKIRRPAQAGAFYEGDAESLRKEVEGCFLHKLGPQRIPVVDKTGPRKIRGLVCPHAGFMYSGPVAALSYFELASDGKPDTVVILGPNHTGLGSALAVMNDGSWRTPLGDVQIDNKLADALVHESGLIDVDDFAHLREHSIEVQLPFLQFLYGSDFKFVPVCFMMQDLATAQEIGRSLVEVLAGKNAVIVASSDFSHYEPAAVATKKDLAALESRMEGKFVDLESRMTTVESRMATKEDLADLESRMATKEDLANIELGINGKQYLADFESKMATRFVTKDYLDDKLADQTVEIFERLDRREEKGRNFRKGWLT